MIKRIIQRGDFLKHLRLSLIWRTRLLLNWPEKMQYQLGLRRVERLNLPHFLILGLPKAGTTWLQSNLQHHPDVFFPTASFHYPPNEVLYFSQYYYQPLTFYAALYDGKAHMVRGDKSPYYYKLPVDRIRFIRSVMPDVRLVLMLREPVDMAWSYIRMKVVREGKRELSEVSDGELTRMIRSRQVSSEIVDGLKRWLSVFPAEQLYIGLYDELSSRPLELLQEVARHIRVRLDVDWDDFPYAEQINKSPAIDIPERYRVLLESVWKGEREKLRAFLGDRIAHWQPEA